MRETLGPDEQMYHDQAQAVGEAINDLCIAFLFPSHVQLTLFQRSVRYIHYITASSDDEGLIYLMAPPSTVRALSLAMNTPVRHCLKYDSFESSSM